MPGSSKHKLDQVISCSFLSVGFLHQECQQAPVIRFDTGPTKLVGLDFEVRQGWTIGFLLERIPGCKTRFWFSYKQCFDAFLFFGAQSGFTLNAAVLLIDAKIDRVMGRNPSEE